MESALLSLKSTFSVPLVREYMKKLNAHAYTKLAELITQISPMVFGPLLLLCSFDPHFRSCSIGAMFVGTLLLTALALLVWLIHCITFRLNSALDKSWNCARVVLPSHTPSETLHLSLNDAAQATRSYALATVVARMIAQKLLALVRAPALTLVSLLIPIPSSQRA